MPEHIRKSQQGEARGWFVSMERSPHFLGRRAHPETLAGLMLGQFGVVSLR